MSMREAAPLERLRIEQGEQATPLHSFAEDVGEGLLSERKRIPARHLYDAIGSALYDAITLLPEYYLMRAETEILTAYAGEMLDRVGGAEIVELGPGNGRKTEIVLDAALRRQPLVRYRPIDISFSALRALAERLVAERERLVVDAYCGDYRSALLDRAVRRDKPTLVMFLGSSIGNYDAAEACELLASIASAMRPNDALLLGTDLKKSRRELELAYDDPTGVTAAFNRNVLARINRELGGRFNLGAFRFVVAYDEARACVDSFQESLLDQHVRIDALGVDVAFRVEERIHTESSYKYDDSAIAKLARAGGFEVMAGWEDAAHRFRVSLLKRR